MRRNQSHPQIPQRPIVGVFTDCTTTYGRAILRGVTRFANLQRRWLLFKDVEKTVVLRGKWPRLDGAIFAGISWEVVERGLKECPHAIYCSSGGDPELSPVVGLDDFAAGMLAAEHLLDCRLENFAFYSLEPVYGTATKRLEGFRAGLQKRGFTCHECPLPRPSARQRMSHAHHPALIRWLMELPKPVGILAFDDTMADDLAGACLEANIGVPDHVAIVGVNNDDLLCESAWPPLSSVDADYGRVGYAAAQTLERLLRGERLAREERLTLLPPLGVVQRQSTSTLAISNADLASAVRFIREHACDPCTVDDVLRAVPVGRRWLERQFMAQLGRSPHDEITRVRIDTAQRLLQHTRLDVAGIAQRCGFSEPKNFYNAFRKTTGATPGQYRQKTAMPRE